MVIPAPAPTGAGIGATVLLGMALLVWLLATKAGPLVSPWTAASCASHARPAFLYTGEPMDDNMSVLLQVEWDRRVADNVMRSPVERRMRKLAGVHELLLVANPGRASKRPPPAERELNITRPFRPEHFNFERIGPAEFLFLFEPAAPGRTPGMTCRNRVQPIRPAHHVLVNAAPLSRYSGLLVPFLEAHWNQVMHLDALLVGIEFARALNTVCICALFISYFCLYGLPRMFYVPILFFVRLFFSCPAVSAGGLQLAWGWGIGQPPALSVLAGLSDLTN